MWQLDEWFRMGCTLIMYRSVFSGLKRYLDFDVGLEISKVVVCLARRLYNFVAVGRVVYNGVCTYSTCTYSTYKNF